MIMLHCARSFRPNSTSPTLLALVVMMLTWRCSANFILSISSTSNQVSNAANMTVSIRTTTAIAALDIVLNNAFTIASPRCTVNAVAVNCSRVVPAMGSTIIVRFSFSFVASNNYTLLFNATNPVYSDSFSVQGYNGATAFGNSGSVTINPKTITCSIVVGSTVVSQLSNTTFYIAVSTLAPNTLGQVSLSVNTQTVFPNIISASPTCYVDSSATACTLGQVFGSQVLSINSVNVGVRSDNSSLSVTINSIRNSPYNATFENIVVSVMDQLGRGVEQCTVQQPPSTTLQQSNSFSVQGWGSLVGQISNVQFILTPFFTPLTDLTIQLVYSNAVVLTPRAPAVFTVATVGSLKYMRITNATYSSQVLSFNATFQNPQSAVPLTITSYILYNDTLFRQHKDLPASSLMLTAQIATLQALLSSPITLVQTSFNFTQVSPLRISNGYVSTVSIAYGNFTCSALNFATNLINATVLNCSTSQLIVSCTSILTAGSSYWMSVGYITPLSIISNTISVMTRSLNNYPIMSASSSVPISISTPIFSVVCTNSTYTAATTYSFVQSNVTALGTDIIRSVALIPPAYVKFAQSAVPTTTNSLSNIVNYSLDIAAGIMHIVIQGKISISIASVINPSHYLGGRDWTIFCNDTNGYPSSNSTSTSSPQYTPARSSVSLSFSNSTIEALSNLTLTFEPLLQYSLSTAPIFIVSLPTLMLNSLNNSTCPGCVMLTSTKFSMPYYSVVMRPIIQVINSRNPINNSMSFTVSINNFVYQTGSTDFIFTPLLFNLRATFIGIFGDLGQLQIKVLSSLSTAVAITYSGTNNIFQSAEQCALCNSTYLQITGIVGYFQSQQVTLQGYANNVLYAQGTVTVAYTCSAIPGCQICDYVNSTWECTRCFSTQYTLNYLLHQNRCFSACPVQTYANGAVCSSCPNLCYLCTASNCLECVTNYYIYEGSCVLDCPPLFIKNATHCLPRPVVCPTNCIDCPSDNVCNKCDASYYLLDNLCYTSCPTSYIANQTSATCILFVPPEQTKYFPFAFFIASMLTLIILSIIKHFERRSLIVGNFISFTSFFQIGAIVMMISYTFMSIKNQPDRWTVNNKLLMQGLLFTIILTKFMLNLIFLLYFNNKMRGDENFQKWKESSVHNSRLQVILAILSMVLSFQMMRIIYCRLLGLQLFFGRFNTSLIFKPINIFSLVYIVPGGCLIVVAIFNILMQQGYRTSIFYSSIQVILVQSVLFIACIIDGCRSNKQYFDYQIYKVQNESSSVHEQASNSKIKIGQHQEVGGSFNQKLLKNQPTYVNSDIQGSQTMGKIIKNRRWREKKKVDQSDTKLNNNQAELEEDFYVDEDEGDQKYYISGLKLSSKVDDKDYIKQKQYNANKPDKTKQRSIFRKKILEDWEQLKKKLPRVGLKSVRRANPILKLSKSPQKQNKKQQRQLQKISSLQKLEKVKIQHLIPEFKDKNLLKSYFYKINIGHVDQPEKIDSSLDEKQSQIKTVEINENQANTELANGTDEGLIFDKQCEVISDVPNFWQKSQSLEKGPFEEKRNTKLDRYEDINEDYENQQTKKNASHDNNSMTKKKLKKRNVNKQTEAVYLQRLISSSEMQRPKPLRRQRLGDF